MDKYLPLSPIRVLVDKQGKNLTDILSYQQLSQRCQSIRKKTAQAVIKQIRGDVEAMLLHANTIANSRLEPAQQLALESLRAAMAFETERLTTLKQVNPNVREDEIDHLRHIATEGAAHIQHAGMQLQALRVVVNT